MERKPLNAKGAKERSAKVAKKILLQCLLLLRDLQRLMLFFP
jgi:hypothetical protein